MLEARSENRLTWNQTVFDGPERVGRVEKALRGRRGQITCGGLVLQIRDRGWLMPKVELSAEGEVMATAKRKGISGRSWRVILPGADEPDLGIKPTLFVGASYTVRRGGDMIGKIGASRGLDGKRVSHIDLPEDMPLALRLFVLWLVLLRWRTEAMQTG
jgi:hypothetical protein